MPYDQIVVKESTLFGATRSILIGDYIRVSESFFYVDRSLVFSDKIIMIDKSLLTKVNAIMINETIMKDYINYKGVVRVNVLDKLITDYASYTKTYYQILVNDVIPIKDYTTYTKTYSPVLFTMLAYRVRLRYLTLSISDYKFVYDYMPVAKGKRISVYDKIAYDYVPSMNPGDIYYMSIYPNPMTYGILVSDYGIFYDAATATRPYKPVVVLDVVGVKDGVAMKNRTIMVYDKLVADNVVLNRV